MALFALELGAGFGTATATVVSTTQESMIVEIHVEVEAGADSVVVHLALPDEETVTIPLVARDDGSHGVTTEVKPADYQVVFEILDDPSAESEAVRLSELGVDLQLAGGSTSTTVAEERSPGTQRWLWLGVALGAASLSALAFWVLGGRDEEVEVVEDVESGLGEPDASPDEERAPV